MIVLLIICILSVLIIYILFIVQTTDSIEDIFRKLLVNNTDKTILAFTHKRLREKDKYLNVYFDPSEGKLVPVEESNPVGHDGVLVESRNMIHGNIIYDDEGFRITGMDFPFRCPQPFEHNGAGKCILKPVCGPNDTNVYRGINFYQFNERSQRQLAFHSRLYYDCDTNEILNCDINELYTGGDILSKVSGIQPCEPYDICQDRMTSFVHQFPITRNDTLKENEFYICINGTSQRRQCPDNHQFSTIQNGCVAINKCANEINNTTFPLSDTSFILCQNGLENIINCQTRALFSDATQRHECRNPRCDNNNIIYTNIDTLFQIPIGVEFCEENNNIIQNFTCDNSDPIQIIDENYLLYQNQNLPLSEINPLFTYYKPTKIFLNDQCIDFDLVQHNQFIINRIRFGSHNQTVIPQVPYNVFTGEITYSTQDGVYRDKTNLIDNVTREIVSTSERYANFVGVTTPESIEFADTVTETLWGDGDGLVYAVKVTRPTNRHPIYFNARCDQFPINCVTGIQGAYYSAYSDQFVVQLEIAHSRVNFDPVVPPPPLFTYNIVNYDESTDLYTISMWSFWGNMLLKVRVQPYAERIGNRFFHQIFPAAMFDTSNNGFVEGYYHNFSLSPSVSYTRQFRATIELLFKIVEILEPLDAIDRLTSVDEIFAIPDDLIYANIVNLE